MSESEEKSGKQVSNENIGSLDKLHEDLKPKIQFSCYLCGMFEECHYKGKEPPFVSGSVKFREESYVIRDPFIAPPPLGKSKAEYFIIIGTQCVICKNLVCKGLSCSFYYNVTYCLSCLEEVMTKLPKEVQVRAKKQIANSK
ncbi:cysteine-rich DPF motif domain-containing protein 1 [Condylostylus longicornis]|uniref:cysteine-rich DPF motif domain-containing protein 1 n=1 Tax=Condylostylus longicornis TaxID=2530218 RepID=UPI00244DA421|nr:cysteine-rich DPF motif domain-containing protein 1 [Condylostylus longicornis]